MVGEFHVWTGVRGMRVGRLAKEDDMSLVLSDG
jgi:hypothetical protein